MKHETQEVFKAILAAEIIKALDRERLTVRGAHGRTGIAAAGFPESATPIPVDSPWTDLSQFLTASDPELR